MSSNRILNDELTEEQKQLEASFLVAKGAVISLPIIDDMPSSFLAMALALGLGVIINGIVDLVDETDKYFSQASFSFPRFWTAESAIQPSLPDGELSRPTIDEELLLLASELKDHSLRG